MIITIKASKTKNRQTKGILFKNQDLNVAASKQSSKLD